MKAKALLLSVSLALTLVFAACGSGDAPEPPAPPPQEEATPAQTDGPPSTEDEPEEAQEPAPLARGIIEEGVYTSEFATLRFTLPGEGWQFLDDAEIAAALDLGVEIMAEEGFDLEDLNLATLYDMVARSEATNSNVMLMIEDLSHTPGAEQQPATVYLEQLRLQLESVELFDFTFEEPRTVALGGQTFDLLTAKVTGEDSEQHYLIRRQGEHMIIIIASLFGDLSFDQLLGLFD